jgi:hypothetical protein
MELLKPLELMKPFQPLKLLNSSKPSKPYLAPHGYLLF